MSSPTSLPLQSHDYLSPELPMRERMVNYVQDLQARIIAAFETLDPSAPSFKRDSWTRVQGGLGMSGVLSGGTVLEKAGVNVSVVHGKLPPAAIKQMRADHSDIPYDPDSNTSLPFLATGISLVIHPRNPDAPTVHANYRYFEISEEPSTTSSEQAAGASAPGGNTNAKVLAWWFGGGSDLTPSYLYEEDAKTFHTALKDACDPHGSLLYPAFKSWCDEYFYIPHRGETRGLGGIFFDDLSSTPHKRLNTTSSSSSERPYTAEEIFAFVRACGDAFIPSYLPILSIRSNLSLHPTSDHKRRWQLIRRGRYVEFNLVYDRGTKFGLATPGARIESILMSLPETARWEYMSEMGDEEGSEEKKLIDILKAPREWA